MHPDRRDWLKSSALIAGASLLPVKSSAENPVPSHKFKFCLNSSTVRGQKLPVEKVFDLAAKAGYQAVEPWIGELEDFVSRGNKPAELKKRAGDLGLIIPDAIGFAEWIVGDGERRKKGLERAKRDMTLVRDCGGTHVAAPPAGATDVTGMSLFDIADRYKVLAELGATLDIIPIAEVWGFSKTMNRLGETVLVAMESGHPKACVLPDIYHLFKGGSGFAGLRMLSASAVGIFHINDYPEGLTREKAADADRIYPGDGVAPLAEVFRHLIAENYAGCVSLELFNREYWKQPAEKVMADGLAKMRKVAGAANG